MQEEETNKTAGQSTDVAVLDYRNLPEYKNAKEKQKNLVKENPFIEITDNKTFDLAKKARTALRGGRYELQNGKKLITSIVAKFKKDVDGETEKLIAITLPHEEKQQAEVERWEEEKRKEKEEEQRIERERVDGIKNKINAFRFKYTELIKAATKATIKGLIEEIDIIVVDAEEFSEDFELVKEQVLTAAGERLQQLKEAEYVKLENERLAKEKAKMELEKKRFHELKSITHIYEGDDLGELTEEAYNAIYDQAKAEFDLIEIGRKRKEKEDKEKQKLGEARRQELKKVECEVDANTCANMNSEVWEEFFKTKNDAYHDAQAKIKAEKQQKEQAKAIEIKRRIDAIKSIGFEFNYDEQRFEFGKVTINVSEFESSETEWFDTIFVKECESIFKVENARIESLIPDKEKLLKAIEPYLKKEPFDIVLTTGDAQKLYNNFCIDIEKLANQYVSQIEKL